MSLHPCSSSNLRVEISSIPKVVILRMVKRPVNSFDIEMLRSFEAVIRALESDPEVEGLVLTSGFAKVFTAGLDLKALISPARSEFEAFWATFESMWRTFYLSPLVPLF